MARLPGINYNTQVQSLGRQDVSGPLRVANAEARALQQWGNVALEVGTMLETNEAAEYAAKMSNELAELNAYVKHTRVYDPNELRAAGMEAEGDEFVPAHEVATEFYKIRANEIYEANTATLGRKGKKVMERTYASKYSAGISDVVGQSIVYAQQYSKAQAEMGFEASVKAGDLEGAIGIAEVARANGTWDPIYYASKMVPVEGRVQEAKYLQQLDIVDDLGQLETLQGQAINDPLLTVTSANRMYGAYNTKINRIEKEREKEAKETKTENSSLSLTELQGHIIEGKVYTRQEMMDFTANFKPGDRKTAMAAWGSQQGKVTISNNDTKLEAAQLIRSTLLPTGGDGDFFDRRRAVQDRLDEMAFNDKTLTAEDHAKFTDRLAKTAKMTITTPEFDMVEDDIYKVLGGGSKEQIEVLPGGEGMLGLALAVEELHERALQGGEAFKPTEWWKQKKPLMITDAMHISRVTWLEKTSSNYVTLDANGAYDPFATAIDLNNRFKNGEMDQRMMEQALTDAAEYYRRKQELEEAHAEALSGKNQ